MAEDHNDDDDDDDDDEAAVHPDVHTSGVADKHAQQAHLRDHDFGGAFHASSTRSPRAEGQTRSDRWRETTPLILTASTKHDQSELRDPESTLSGSL